MRRKLRRFLEYMFAFGLAAGVFWGVYMYYSVVVMPIRDECSARGGVVVYDAFNMPTCAVGAPVFLHRRRN